MIRNVFNRLYKPDYLIINNASVVYLDHELNLKNIFYDPQELQQILSNDTKNQRPLRVVIDAYDHDYSKAVLPSHQFWQRQNLIDKYVESRSYHFSKPINFYNVIGHQIHLITVAFDNQMQAWFDAINVSRRTILSLESIAYGLSRLASSPRLYILANQFKQLRLIFVDGQGGILCRFLNHNNEHLPIIEIQRTIHYVCREFNITADHIEIISSMQCPEIDTYVKSWQYIPIDSNQSERYLISLLTLYNGHYRNNGKCGLTTNQRRFFLTTLVQPMFFVMAVMITGANSFKYYYNQQLQLKIDKVLKHNQLLQQQYDQQQSDQNCQDYPRLQAINKAYTKARSKTCDPLQLFYKLSLAAQPTLQMNHLVYLKTSKEPLLGRLLLEYNTTNAHYDKIHADDVYNLEHYNNVLKSQFKDAVISIDQNIEANGQGNITFDNMADDVNVHTLQSIIIQIDRIKL